ncbi:uncharacterized protein [Lolium perenne]|uniref:uncharacterized protein n=1 Tax=Lolium perenne TaxID=4522 RepID=UPI003A992E12
MDSSGSNVAGDDAARTTTPSDSVNSLGPVFEDTPPRLRFTIGPCPHKFPPADAPGFISSIDDALARHAGADAQVESLEISLVFAAPYKIYLTSLGTYATEHPHAALIKAHHIRAWLRYGMARAAKSFVLEVPPPCPPLPKNEAIVLDLPASAAAVTMALTLGNATLNLPAPAEASFHALTDLLLSNARIADGDRLGELLSSPSFPCLKRLRLQYLPGLTEQELAFDELEELTIVTARDLQCLVVHAQCMRTLCVTDCPSLESANGELAIVAPALQALTCANICSFQPGLQFSARSVREIGELPLWTHGHQNEASRNQASIYILKHCGDALHRLHLHLHVPLS